MHLKKFWPVGFSGRQVGTGRQAEQKFWKPLHGGKTCSQCKEKPKSLGAAVRCCTEDDQLNDPTASREKRAKSSKTYESPLFVSRSKVPAISRGFWELRASCDWWIGGCAGTRVSSSLWKVRGTRHKRIFFGTKKLSIELYDVIHDCIL